ncbi:hypothetical protein BM86_11805 [Bacillus thuringiensis]|uniref:Uncharacterized protein n=1 Tax=Bacillus thuringiensis TaxID=1428 RepID=A0A9W3SBW5_BACTU|nr:hypothetical protein [Bacillus thuringiensis]ANS47590.1 hypothetical protein BT246_22160 [Bacillus thuringiensis]MBH0336157.1 hypothetical protein [Bacillus thuringiensis]
MLKITEEQAKAVRRKRADLQMTKSQACKEMGIGSLTLRNVENGNYSMKPSSYAKVMQWLAKDY